MAVIQISNMLYRYVEVWIWYLLTAVLCFPTTSRYNDPTTPPAVRRNEVLIELQGYVWPPA